jgi:hypothetical protein
VFRGNVKLSSKTETKGRKPKQVDAETKLIEDWIDNELIYYSTEKYKYYVLSSTFPDAVADGCYELDFDKSNAIFQMRNANRAFIGHSTFKSTIIGIFSQGVVTEDSANEEVVSDLSVVQSVQGLLGGVDVLKAFNAVNKLLLLWGVTTYQKVALLGFNPIAMDIESQDEVQQRFSLLLNIHEQLRILFDNPVNCYGYMSNKNHNEPYNGQCPINVACEGIEGLRLVYNSLLSVRQL